MDVEEFARAVGGSVQFVSTGAPTSKRRDLVPAAAKEGRSFGTVTAGITYFFQASGLVTFLGAGNCQSDPDGRVAGCASGSVPTARRGGNQFVCPELSAWSLVGKIANQCIQLGSSGSFVAPASGELVLYCNDRDYSDNGGAWDVTLWSDSGASASIAGVSSAYRFLKPEFGLRVRVDPVQPQIEAVVRNAVRIGIDQIGLQGTVDYTIKRVGVFALRLALPAGYRVERVTGDNISQWAEKDVPSEGNRPDRDAGSPHYAYWRSRSRNARWVRTR